MENGVDNFFLKIPEPQQSTLLFLRYFLKNEMQLQESMKFNTPFYYFENKWFGYLIYNAKKQHEIYFAFVKGYLINHPSLLSEGRKQIKIYRINPNTDIDMKTLQELVQLLKKLY